MDLAEALDTSEISADMLAFVCQLTWAAGDENEESSLLMVMEEVELVNARATMQRPATVRNDLIMIFVEHLFNKRREYAVKPKLFF